MLAKSFLSAPFAHRGLWNEACPENSLAACLAAVDAGYGIEVDIQASADGEAMVFHDEHLERMTGRAGWLCEYSAADLSQMPLLTTSQTIPTLKRVLDAVDGRAAILVELKDQTPRPGGRLGPLEDRVAEVLRTYPGPIAVMSSHPGMVQNLAQAAPDVSRGTVGNYWKASDVGECEARERNTFATFEQTGCSFLSHDWENLSMPGVAKIKKAGYPVLCWTVRSPEQEAIARQVADNVTFENYLPA